MLINALKLEDARLVVTPGVKGPNDKGDHDQIDQDVAAEIHHIVAELSPKIKPMTKAKFSCASRAFSAGNVPLFATRASRSLVVR